MFNVFLQFLAYVMFFCGLKKLFNRWHLFTYILSFFFVQKIHDFSYQPHNGCQNITKKKKATSEWGLCQFFTRNEYPEAKIFKAIYALFSFVYLPNITGKKKTNYQSKAITEENNK